MNTKKITIRLIIVMFIAFFSLTFTSCKISESYAKKINDAYDNGTPLTYNDVMLRLGTPFSKEINGSPSVATGYAEWFQGYVEGEETKFVKDNKKGKKIKAIYVEFINGKAIGARYYVVNG